ncbi:hypothetical protein PVT71_27145 (plasmid) [Salipiger sp. H15]|uniref:Uncharacterized protein n=1 Tax=Alloyangia sp. H15 TaxID=3029062 RepID=A0AAU8AS50_9RHOB
MSPEELVSQLAPIRVPAEFARFGLQDALCAISLGLVAGLLLARLLRVFVRPRVAPRGDVKAEIAALAGLGRHERLLGLAAILARMELPPPAGLSEALYDPGAEFDPAIAERAVLAAREAGPRA